MKKITVRNRFGRKTFLNVLAEEPNTDPNTDPNAEVIPPVVTQVKPEGTVNFEDLIRKAREEEKNKLYPQIEKLKGDKNDLLLVVGERDKEIATLKKQLAKVTGDLTNVTKEVEEGTKTNTTVQALNLTISQLENQLEDIQGRYDTDIQSLKLSSYRDTKVAQAGGNIIAELVVGNTEEEIDASIVQAKQRFSQIQEQALSGIQMPRANPATSQLNAFANKSIEEISTMSNAEYAVYRKEMGLK